MGGGAAERDATNLVSKRDDNERNMPCWCLVGVVV